MFHFAPPEFARVPAGEFLRDVVHERLQAREVYLGRGFAFGRGREGTPAILADLCGEAGLACRIVPPVALGTEAVLCTHWADGAAGAADLDPELLIGLLVTGLEQVNLAPVLEAKWRQRGEAALHPEPP